MANELYLTERAGDRLTIAGKLWDEEPVVVHRETKSTKDRQKPE